MCRSKSRAPNSKPWSRRAALFEKLVNRNIEHRTCSVETFIKSICGPLLHASGGEGRGEEVPINVRRFDQKPLSLALSPLCAAGRGDQRSESQEDFCGAHRTLNTEHRMAGSRPFPSAFDVQCAEGFVAQASRLRVRRASRSAIGLGGGTPPELAAETTALRIRSPRCGARELVIQNHFNKACSAFDVPSTFSK